MTLAMLVLCIDIATAYGISLGVDKVKLYHTSDIAVVLLCSRRRLWLVNQLKEHTRGKCHLVVTRSGVTLLVGLVSLFPVVVGSSAVSITRVCSAHMIHLHVAGKVAQTVHKTVDAEIVAVSCCIGGIDFLQRQLTHTVDGVALFVLHLRHTVEGSLQHHT